MCRKILGYTKGEKQCTTINLNQDQSQSQRNDGFTETSR